MRTPKPFLETLRLALLCLALCCGWNGVWGAVDGLPSMRVYTFDEIGLVARGARLSFDTHGRIAVVTENSYVVLNDDRWQPLIDEDRPPVNLDSVATDRDGTLYYGTLASWGVLKPDQAGRLHPEPLLGPKFPKWVLSTNFNQILCTDEGIYLAGLNGVVFRSKPTGTEQFFEISGVSRILQLSGVVYASTYTGGLVKLDVQNGRLEGTSMLGGITVRDVCALGPDRAVIGSTGRRLFVWESGKLTPLPGPLGGNIPGTILALQALPEGDFAASIGGVGVFILDAEGRIKLRLTGPEYSRATAFACSEPGVLWASTESGVLKILYNDPFTVVGQSIGLPVSWPQVLEWNDTLIICSSGRLFQETPGTETTSTRFQTYPGEPAIGAWAIAGAGDTLLIGNVEGVFAKTTGETQFKPIMRGFSVDRLVATDSDTCYVIGATEIGVLKRANGTWVEAAPRISGVGYPGIVHRTSHAAWVEAGVNRAARLALKGQRLELRLFETFPWTTPSWLHVSPLGSITVLNGAANDRIYFDETSETFVASPELDSLLRASPRPIQRLVEDADGVFWGSHRGGILTLKREAGEVVVDTSTYAGIKEQVPIIQRLADGDIWVSTGQSLYGIKRAQGPRPSAAYQPVLVSVRDDRTNEELLNLFRPNGTPAKLEYRQNDLTFTFFSGSYAERRSSTYRYQLNEGEWKGLRTGSSMQFSNLREGPYRLTVQAHSERGELGVPTTLRFAIRPPWYRSWYAMAAYPAIAALLLFGFARLTVRRSEARNVALESLIEERTKELKAAMDRLKRETQVSATLAERNRLAEEIHDTLEQGFTGIALQLEATATLPQCSPEVKSGLSTALSMVSFSRNEVRNAVWNLHSTILDSDGLGRAIATILEQLKLPPGFATVSIQGSPRPLSSAVEHHLLRIAQEAIANVIKHAQATKLAVGLSYGEASVELTIDDNGQGFDPGAVLDSTQGHFGIPSFKGRAQKIGGTVEIVSRRGGGTRIRVSAPAGPPPEPSK